MPHRAGNHKRRTQRAQVDSRSPREASTQTRVAGRKTRTSLRAGPACRSKVEQVARARALARSIGPDVGYKLYDVCGERDLAKVISQAKPAHCADRRSSVGMPNPDFREDAARRRWS